jgi:hypothetical protein
MNYRKLEAFSLSFIFALLPVVATFNIYCVGQSMGFKI